MSTNLRRWLQRGVTTRPNSARSGLRSSRLQLVSLEDRSTPALFTVLNLAESGTGSLREAITFANKLPGADVIRFAPSVVGTIDLLGQIDITEPVSIEGPGAAVLTVANAANAASTSRIFNIDQATAGSMVTISGLTISGGKVAGGATPNGGAIRNANANLFLNNVIIEGNSTSGAGGGIALETKDADLSLFQSVIRENSSAKSGGGIAVIADSDVIIHQTTFNNNTAALHGGGLSFANGGVLQIDRSTLYANQAGTNPGEVGGGVSIVGAVNTLILNSTFSGNSAASGGGIAAKASGMDVPTVNIFNSTFTLNTATINAANSAGGIAQLGGAAAWFSINSSAIAQNVSALTIARDFSSASSTVNMSNSFLGVLQPGLTITGSGNISGTDASPADAKLGVLQQNGGLPVLTHAPLSTSPLIGAGTNLLGLTTDQRGVTRSIGATDIGAVEGNGPVATLTTAPAVTVAGGTSYFLTVTYEAANTAIIDASKLGAADLNITGPAGSLTVHSVSGISKSGTPLGIVTAVTYKVTPPGGAWQGIHNGPYTVTVNLNEVFDNQATPQAVTMPTFIGKFNVVIPQTFLVTNLNDSGPGSLRDALTLANADMDLYGLSTKDTINFLPGLTGTISLNSPLEIRDSVTINGPGAKLLFLNGQGLGRVVDVNGPGQIDVALNNLAIQNGAPSMGHGGGIRVANEILTLDTVQIFSNSTADPAGQGGGIAVGTGGLLRLLNSLVANNTASTLGGGIFLDDESSFYILNSSIIGNTSGTNGGGIAFNGLVANGTLPADFVDSELRLINSTIGENLANKSGGGVALNITSGSLRATNSTIVNNTATETGASLGGGGIHRTGLAGGIILENTVVAKNANATAPDIAVDAGFTTVIADRSLIGAKTGLVVTGLGNLGGTNATPLDPQLGGLTINGKFSGILFNYEPLAGSPLIDAGNNVTTTALGLTVDQRSAPFARVFNSKVDIGAIERQPRPNFGAPTVAPTMAPPATFVEGGGPVFVDTSLNVFDNVDDPQQFSKITVQITGNYQAGADVLSVTDVGSVTSSFNATTGTLTLTAPTKDSAANFSASLATLKFNNTSQAPTLLPRTLTIIATDATDDTITPLSSAPVARTVTVTGENQAPVITVPTGSFTVEVTKSIVITGLSVSDVDVGSGNITVTVSVPATIGTFNGVGFTSGQGTESITVTDTLANVNTALSTLTFTAGTTLGVVTVTVHADDLGNTPGPNLTDTKTFNISISTAPPVLTISPGDVTYFERQEAPAFDNIDKLLVVTDDSGNLGGAFVQITSGFQASEDELYLLAAPPPTITADTSISGKITFTGVASTADYQAILRQVAFKNSSFDPNTTPRVVTFSVQDPTDPISVTGTRTINIVAVNDPPTFVSAPTGPFSVATNATFHFTGSKLIQIADPDSRNQPEQIFLSVIDGTLSVTPFGGTTVTGNGTTTITMKGTVTELNNTLSTLAFHSPANAVLVTLSGGVNDLGNSGTGGAKSSDLPPVILNVLGAPKVNSMTLLSKNPSKLDTVEFLVNFDQPVTGVDLGDFQIIATGLTGATVMSVTGSGASYTVSVNTGSGSGALRLDLIDNDSITNGATPLGGVGVGNGNFTSGPLANIDRLGPIVTVNRAPGQAATTKDSPIRFVITFSEPVTGFTASNLVVSPAGLTANLTGSGANYIVALTGMTTASTVSVTVPAGVVADELGNPNPVSTGTNSVQFDPNFGMPPPPPPPPVVPPPPPPPPPPTVPPPPVVPPTNRDFLAVAPAAGGGPIIKVYSTDGKQRYEFVGGDPDSRDGLTVATGDVNGDGIDDIIVGAGPGTAPLIRVFNGANGFQINTILAFAESFTGGINVAAGDVDGDGKADIIVGAGFGGGPHIRVFDSTGGQLATFFAYAADFRGGVNVATGDLDGDGKAEIIAGAGNGGGPHVRTFRGDATPLATFFAYNPNFRGGVFVSGGDVDGDGIAEIITGTGVGGGAHVRVFAGLNADPIGGFFAYDSTFRGGVRVAAQDTNGDGKKEIVTAPGPGGGPNVRVFTTSFTSNPPPPPPNQTPAPVAPPVPILSFFAFEEEFFGGVFIG